MKLPLANRPCRPGYMIWGALFLLCGVREKGYEAIDPCLHGLGITTNNGSVIMLGCQVQEKRNEFFV